MATRADFADFVLEQLQLRGRTRVRKMFGEYALYCDDKTVALLCDNELYLKPLPELLARCPDLPMGPAIPDGKPHLKANLLLDDAERLRALILLTAELLPAAKSKGATPPKKTK
ncbi:MAG: hypothetical protein RLZZ502_1349 [Pseudomonadota bacterium]